MSRSYYFLIGVLAIAALIVAGGAYYKTMTSKPPVIKTLAPAVMPKPAKIDLPTNEATKAATASGVATPSGAASRSGKIAP